MAKLCLSLTAATIRGDLDLLERYRGKVDLVELRVDCLKHEERFHLRRFPELAGLPVILTVRRKINGGRYMEGEATRTVLYAKGLAFAEDDPRKNYAYIDVEDDLRAPGIEEAARTFGTVIIRSVYGKDGFTKAIQDRVRSCGVREGEILKIAPNICHFHDLVELYRFSRDRSSPCSGNRIVTGIGANSLPVSILADRFGSAFSYTSSAEEVESNPQAAPIDPDTLVDLYRFRKIGSESKVFGIVGTPLANSKSPHIHNPAFDRAEFDAVYLPFRTDTLSDFMALARELPIEGFSVTVPYKEQILPFLDEQGPEVRSIGSCNTVVRRDSTWQGSNTDAQGFSDAACEFMKRKNLRGLRVCVIGAGGAAKGIAFALKGLGAKCCVLNRNPARAKALAARFDFEWGGLDVQGIKLISKYSDLIVQTTSAGMIPNDTLDPIDLYDFTGRESLIDIIYKPAETVLIKRAKLAGCRTCNGISMLRYQGYYQFERFTGTRYPGKAEI